MPKIGYFFGSLMKTLKGILTTKGDILTFNTQEARLAVGANDTVLTADSTEDLGIKWAAAGGGGGKTFAVKFKTSNETINNDSTLSDDAELLFTPTINKLYQILMFVYTNSGTTADFKQAFTIPTGATIQINAGDFQVTPQNLMDGETPFPDVSSGLDQNKAILIRLVMSSTAGNCVYQWAQNVSDAEDTTLLEGSVMIVWEEQ